jgi:ABC-2 type transport system ATP-binding protein
LQVRSQTKYRAGLPAVSDISFTVGAGEIFGYLGPNGSGKSATVKMLTGLLEPSRGVILHRGEDIRRDTVACKRRIGFVPEEPYLYPFLSGWECIELAETLRDLPRKKWEPLAQAMLEDFLLHRHRHSLLASYSKGMRQRVLLIAAMIHDTEILILEDPFSGLDVTRVLVLRRVADLLGQRGKAILFSSPLVELVEKTCTHLLVLRRGSGAGLLPH